MVGVLYPNFSNRDAEIAQRCRDCTGMQRLHRDAEVAQRCRDCIEMQRLHRDAEMAQGVDGLTCGHGARV